MSQNGRYSEQRSLLSQSSGFDKSGTISSQNSSEEEDAQDYFLSVSNLVHPSHNNDHKESRHTSPKASTEVNTLIKKGGDEGTSSDSSEEDNRNIQGDDAIMGTGHAESVLGALNKALVAHDAQQEPLYSAPRASSDSPTIKPTQGNRKHREIKDESGEDDEKEKATKEEVTDPHRLHLMQEKQKAIERLESLGYDPYTGLYAAHREKLMEEKSKCINSLEKMGYDPKTGLYAAHRGALMRVIFMIHLVMSSTITGEEQGHKETSSDGI